MPDSDQPDRPLPLLLGKGWKQSPARESGYYLLWESEGKLKQASTSFSDLKTLGTIGLIDCPVATAGTKAYRYACSTGMTHDFSEIRAYDIQTGTETTPFRLGLNQWIVWLLRHLKKEDVLVAMVATHMPGEVVRIQHQLGLFDLKKSKRLLVPLPTDAFMPCDLHEERREVLFSGAEGWQVVELNGTRTALLRQFKGLPEGRGGSFHPSRPLVALGGRGIAVWNRDRGNIQTIHPRGQQPVWSPNGEALYFSESSSDLWLHQYSTNTTERIFEVAGNKYSEVTQARSVVLTPDGKLGAVPVIRRIRRAQGEEGPTFNYYYSLVVLDFEQREIWQCPVKARNAAFLARP